MKQKYVSFVIWDDISDKIKLKDEKVKFGETNRSFVWKKVDLVVAENSKL